LNFDRAMKLHIGRLVAAKDVSPASVICRQLSMALPLPIRAFPGQDLTLLMRGMRTSSLGIGEGKALVPPLDLNLFTIENGTFFVGHGLDGAILAEGNRPIYDTVHFTTAYKTGRLENSQFDLPEPTQLGEVFVGFDGAWTNYFHWMCFGAAKSFLAAQLLGPEVVIAVPDYGTALADSAIAYSEATWQQSLAFSYLSDRVTRLPKGVYRASKLHFFWTAPDKPTDIMYSSVFKDVFDRMSARRGPASKEFENIYLTRSDHVERRLDPRINEIVARVLGPAGFTTVQAEGLDLAAQITMFANAKRVVSSHGAGLVNMLFHRGGLKILELNQDLDGNNRFRPWFYVTSAIRRHRYVTLDSAMPDFGREHVEAAMAALDS
jgi:hypothetical protein